VSTADPRYQKACDTIRILAAETVEKAASGHPGMPMGCADIAFTLWSRFLRHNPGQPNWLGRDRYVQSAGHGSPLVYALLHLFDYGLTMEDLQQFRQWQSLTPGHPEYGWTPGVEVTTGPLGTGFATAVGMAIGAKQLAARMGDEELFGQRIFVIAGDGCMMEGVTHEAASLAGHQKLDNLICFYDDNSITIEGATSLAFSEDVGRRFEAYGWQVIKINGQDHAQIEDALARATANTDTPSLIIAKTTIGCGAPNLAGSHETHGAPLGEEEIAALKTALGFPADQSFNVPADVRELVAERIAALRQEAAEWDARLDAFKATNPEKARLLDQLCSKAVPGNILDELMAAVPEKATATRSSGGTIMQRAAALVPSLCGGAADLNPSTKTHLKAEGDFSPAERTGRNIHFGVREFTMGLCANGLALYGTGIPFTATFMVFSDFMKPAMRLAALQGLQVVNVFTHDSIFVGEDGPTHQPIEQLMMMRGIPGMTVIRPAESNEVAQAWAAALQADGPVAVILTRQTVQNMPADVVATMAVAKGAYVVSDDEAFEVMLIATGSEVQPAMEAADALRGEGRKVRVVSMPSWELFEKQDAAYKESVMPSACRKRVTVEAGITMGWERYAGTDGAMIGVDHFGHSAPYKILADKYGLTGEKIAATVRDYLG